MNKGEFLQVAKNIPVLIDGIPVAGTVRAFKTGSVGWNANGKVTIKLPNGDIVKCQLSMNLALVGSKEWESGFLESGADEVA